MNYASSPQYVEGGTSRLHLTAALNPCDQVSDLLSGDAFEANRWIAQNLFKAFDEARRRSVERMLDITASATPLPWGTTFAHEVTQLFGGDPWPYGIEANRATLEAFCRFGFEQGVACRLLTPDELFPSEVRKAFRV